MKFMKEVKLELHCRISKGFWAGLYDVVQPVPPNFLIVETVVFPVVMYGCESWTVKKAEHWRIDAFELWCWRRLLRVPWTARRSNQSILKEINPEYSLERLKLKYFGLLMWRADSLEKDPNDGKDWGQEEKGTTEGEMVEWHHQLNGHEFEQALGDGEGQGRLVCCSEWGHKESDTTEQLSNHHHHLTSYCNKWKYGGAPLPITCKPYR